MKKSMKASAIASLLMVFSLNPGAADTPPAHAAKPLATIAALDLPRYRGTWYDIAKFPNRFQKKSVGLIKPTYFALADDTLQVVNRCRTANGKTEEAIGAARQVGAGLAQAEGAFRSSDCVLPADNVGYSVIDMDPGYQLAAVSETKREYLWPSLQGLTFLFVKQ